MLRKIHEEYITQVSGETDGGVTKELSQEFSWTENRILGVLFNLDEFFMSPQVPAHSGSVQYTSWNSTEENQETNKDRCQKDPHFDFGTYFARSPQNSALKGHPIVSLSYLVLETFMSEASRFSKIVKVSEKPTNAIVTENLKFQVSISSSFIAQM